VHRLDQCTRNIPAKLFDYRALTLKAEGQTDLAGIFAVIVRIGGAMYELAQTIPNVEVLLALEPEALGGKLLFLLRKRTFQGNMLRLIQAKRLKSEGLHSSLFLAIIAMIRRMACLTFRFTSSPCI